MISIKRSEEGKNTYKGIKSGVNCGPVLNSTGWVTVIGRGGKDGILGDAKCNGRKEQKAQ